MDSLILRGIRCQGRHGALPGEKDAPQDFEVDIEVRGSFAGEATGDRLDATLDYREIHNAVIEAVERESFNLMETLAEEIARRLLALPGVDGVVVTLKKMRPPGMENLDWAGIRLERRQQ